ncbi:MAG: ATP-binding cassette domain-containing protein [Pseudomonadota bacterium]
MAEYIHLHMSHGVNAAFRLTAGMDLDLHRGPVAVFGPSGAGKTTLLRLIAGLDRPEEGIVRLHSADGPAETWFDQSTGEHLSPERRGIGFVFQDPTLFPHLTVANNLAYARTRAKRRGVALSDANRATCFDHLRLNPLLDRRVQNLSGGEARRVALMRALESAPRLLLLDEAFSGLDRARKTRLIGALKTILAESRIACLFVTHAEEELAALSRQVVQIENGTVHPPVPTADFLTHLSPDRATPLALLEAEVMGIDARQMLLIVKVSGATITVPYTDGTIGQILPGQMLTVVIDARDVALFQGTEEETNALATGLSIRNHVPATVAKISAPEDSPFATVALDTGDQQIWARLTRASVSDLGLAPGMAVQALVKAVRLSP